MEERGFVGRLITIEVVRTGTGVFFSQTVPKHLWCYSPDVRGESRCAAPNASSTGVPSKL